MYMWQEDLAVFLPILGYLALGWISVLRLPPPERHVFYVAAMCFVTVVMLGASGGIFWLIDDWTAPGAMSPSTLARLLILVSIPLVSGAAASVRHGLRSRRARARHLSE